MISRTVTKFIKSLQLKKYRKIEQLFTVEGEKSVLEVLQSSFSVQRVVATSKFVAQYESQLINIETLEVGERELPALGHFKSNNSALAIVEMKTNKSFTVGEEFVLALDGINDPGNLGTIIRVADWYGIEKVIASEETAEFYNPKVIAASKGSFTRIQPFYTNLVDFISEQNVNVFGALMDGESVHDTKFGKSGIVIMGNESNGISPPLISTLTKKISIPRYGGAESLNVGVATAVICDNILRG